MSKKNKEKSVIQTCIDKSKWINYAIAAKEQLKLGVYFANHVPVAVLEMDKLRESANNSWNQLIDDWKRTIARFLNKKFESKGIKTEEKFWFSTNDLLSGFVYLYKNAPIVSLTLAPEHLRMPDYVLFLTDFKDCLDGTPIRSGDILLYRDVRHNIQKKGHIPGVLKKEDLIVWYKRKNKSNET